MGLLAIAFALASHCVGARVDAEESDTQESADWPGSSTGPAAKLLAATVTVRIVPQRDVPQGDAPPRGAPDVAGAAQLEPPARDVTVCSGVVLRRGLIVTFAKTTSNARFRITLADGEQAEAKLRVIDQYSGLSLLHVDKPDLTGLELAPEPPRIGGVVLTAAAAGIEPPVVSRGILGATDRLLPGTPLPPLLQCDVRTTETSSGAAVVDRLGRLIGVVAATAAPGERRGWTYALPAGDVERLLRAYKPQQLVLLERRRPTAGLTLGQGRKEGTVEVERIEPGGPAERAGVRAGDVVLEAEGRKLRSAYQAVELILKRQPGDEVQLLVERGNDRRSITILLGGGGQPTDARESGGVVVGPQLRLRAVDGRSIEVHNAAGVEEVAVGPAAPAGGRMARDELSMLRAQLAAFEKVIQRLQLELERRDELQAKTEDQLRELTAELVKLRAGNSKLRSEAPDEP
jgi:S1-C subfamily serine protease